MPLFQACSLQASGALAASDVWRQQQQQQYADLRQWSKGRSPQPLAGLLSASALQCPKTCAFS
jgi:hypothetical protein